MAELFWMGRAVMMEKNRPRGDTLPETNTAPEIGHPKRKLVFQPSIFRCYVSFWGCTLPKKMRVANVILKIYLQ